MADSSIITSSKKSQRLIGCKFHLLTVLSRAAPRSGRNVYWVCVCECGTFCTRTRRDLVTSRVKSCGCLRRQPKQTVRKTFRREHTSWCNMRRRCTDPSDQKFHHYGARGIFVCERWLCGEGEKDGFACFLEDMGERPNGTTLDRMDNNGPYCKDNCRWAADRTQQNNKRTNIRVTYMGESRTAAEWAKIKGIPYKRFMRRLKSGMPLDRLFSPTSRRKSFMTEQQVLEIYALKGKMKVKHVAEKYGTSVSHVSEIQTGVKWKSITKHNS